MRQHYARCTDDRRKFQLLAAHLHGVGRRCAEFASQAVQGDTQFAGVAAASGLLHDLGKYREEFAQYLLSGTGQRSAETAHAMYGAAAACFEFNLQLAAFAIGGHHAGLHDLSDLQILVAGDKFQADRRYPELLLCAQQAQELGPIPLVNPIPFDAADDQDKRRYEMLTRMLFSMLVDADRLDSEQWEQEQRLKRPWARRSRPLEPTRLLELLDAERRRRAARVAESDLVRVRNDVFEACLAGGRQAARGLFVSSVQKELENERVAVAEIIWTDPFLSTHCDPILYEYEPASPNKATDECLATVDRCQVYLLMIGNDYGHVDDLLSITHREYRRAKQRALPILVFIKGTDDSQRSVAVREKLLKEVRDDGCKYKRFANYRDLQKEVRASLVKLLEEQHGLVPSSDENEIAEQTIEVASDFGKQRVSLRWQELNLSLARELVAAADGAAPSRLTRKQVERTLLSRGLIGHDTASGQSFATAAGVVLLSDDPTRVFPQCRMLTDAFRGTERSSKPDDQEEIRAPMPLAITRALEFINRNTRHPMRVVGLSRIRLDEYPSEAIREALVNAVAHRRYELEGQKIMVTVFSDRLVVASPGLLPKPLTLEKIRKGNYRPCSRNPLIAHGLSFFHRIEERGSGFARMRDEMIDHGLDVPKYETNSGFFEVIFPGPGDHLDRLRVRASAVGQLIKPSAEAQINERQRQMLALLAQGEELTSRRCQGAFGVTHATAATDFSLLLKLGLVQRLGQGRSTRYVYRPAES